MNALETIQQLWRAPLVGLKPRINDWVLYQQQRILRHAQRSTALPRSR